jgi:magnesium transporter
MPELDWYWGYPLTLFVMAIVTLAMVVYFWRRRWIG